MDEVELVSSLDKVLNGLEERAFIILGITNQPDIARGKITPEFLAEKHAKLLQRYPQVKKNIFL